MARKSRNWWVGPVLIVAGLAILAGRRMLANILRSQSIRVDPAGDGHFGSHRTGHVHEGVDLLVAPGEAVFSPLDGIITKHGFPYAGDSVYRYIEVKGEGRAVRVMYAKLGEGMRVGQPVKRGQCIGWAQDVTLRYGNPDMLPHLHVELRTAAGGGYGPPTDPAPFLTLLS